MISYVYISTTLIMWYFCFGFVIDKLQDELDHDIAEGGFELLILLPPRVHVGPHPVDKA